MDGNKIYIKDDSGNEIEMNILFTFDSEDGETHYAVVYEQDNEGDYFAFQYDMEGNLYMVEDEEELEMIQEVLDAFEDTKQ